MNKHEKIKEQVLSGVCDANINFDELCKLATFLGFRERIKGDHHIFSKTGVRDIINIQPGNNGKAKPYQVRQVRNLIQSHSL